MARQRIEKEKEENVHQLVREYWQSLEAEGSEQTKQIHSPEFRKAHPPSGKGRIKS